MNHWEKININTVDNNYIFIILRVDIYNTLQNSNIFCHKKTFIKFKYKQ